MSSKYKSITIIVRLLQLAVVPFMLAGLVPLLFGFGEWQKSYFVINDASVTQATVEELKCQALGSYTDDFGYFILGGQTISKLFRNIMCQGEICCYPIVSFQTDNGKTEQTLLHHSWPAEALKKGDVLKIYYKKDPTWVLHNSFLRAFDTTIIYVTIGIFPIVLGSLIIIGLNLILSRIRRSSR